VPSPTYRATVTACEFYDLAPPAPPVRVRDKGVELSCLARREWADETVRIGVVADQGEATGAVPALAAGTAKTLGCRAEFHGLEDVLETPGEYPGMASGPGRIVTVLGRAQIGERRKPTRVPNPTFLPHPPTLGNLPDALAADPKHVGYALERLTALNSLCDERIPCL
jgi:hypothetical protein